MNSSYIKTVASATPELALERAGTHRKTGRHEFRSPIALFFGARKKRLPAREAFRTT